MNERRRRALGAVVLALSVLLTTGSSVRVIADEYSTMVQELRETFRAALEPLSPARLSELESAIASIRQQLAALEAMAKGLDALALQIEPARAQHRAAAAAEELARAASEPASRKVDNDTAVLRDEANRFEKEFGDFNERWGLPRGGGGRRTVTADQQARYERELAPFQQRSAGIVSRGETLKNEQDRVDALETETERTVQRVKEANREVDRVMTAVSDGRKAFAAARSKIESDVRSVAGADAAPSSTKPGVLSPFPAGNGPRPNLPLLVRIRPGSNTNALQQLQATDANGLQGGRCFDEGCSATGPGVGENASTSTTTIVPARLVGDRAYEKTRQAALEAQERFAILDGELRTLMRDQTATSEQLTAKYKEVSGANAMRVITGFNLKLIESGSGGSPTLTPKK